MDRRKRLGLRLHRALLYWGLLRHRRGRAAAREQYTPTGKRRAPPDDSEEAADDDRAGD
ncbi:hypothetical protein [Natrinema sp. H-ect4]|uniref:hypothetical protein n=1 Tax=Natrinema sp. H-ect4 TaxID=3242699 RepID=UPI0035A936E3